jgi:uncharacterized protein RhaS with RHS repeats
VSEDPVGLRGGPNLYSYVRNNPQKWVDPYGLDVVAALYHALGGIDHVGIGVNSFNTSGFYAVQDGLPAASGLPVDGEVNYDVQEHPDGPRVWVRIRTTQKQDAAVQAFINQRRTNPGEYRLFGRSCVTFVQDALRAAGIDTRRNDFPRALIDQLANLPEVIEVVRR